MCRWVGQYSLNRVIHRIRLSAVRDTRRLLAAAIGVAGSGRKALTHMTIKNV